MKAARIGITVRAAQFDARLAGAGTANIDGVLSLQSVLFACLSGAHMLVLRIIQELWQSSGGVFNVDEVLQQMVFGLEEELELRSQQAPSMDPAAPGVAAAGRRIAETPLTPAAVLTEERELT